MSSTAENNVPIQMERMTKGAAASADLLQQQQQARQVLGNVGNSGVNFNQAQQAKKKEQQQNHFLNQELRKEQQPEVISSEATNGNFYIYTDSNSPKSDAVAGSAASRYSSGAASDDSENLPPKMGGKAGPVLLPSIQHGELANQCFAGRPVATVAPVAGHQGRCQSEEENRAPFSEIIVDTPGDVRSASSQAAVATTFRELMYELPDYQTDILEYLKEAEVRFRPKPDYMRKQPDINGNMRTVLVDWVVEVCEEYKLNTETLYLAVSYVDRFLSIMSVVRSKLQLVGTSAMFIAAKLEEIYPPDVADFVYITDDTYTKKQVLRMEQLILRALSFDVSAPTPHLFVNLFAVMENLSDPVRHLAMYLCELSLLYSTPFLQYLPSRIASAALAYARLLLNYEGKMWTRSMELMTGYELGHLHQVILELSAVHEKSPQMVQKAVPEKYKSAKFNEVAQIEAIELTEAMFAQTYQAIAKELEDVVTDMSVQEGFR